MSAQIGEQNTRRELEVNDEFKNLIPRLSDQEYQLLEESIEKDGCLNPIIVWGNVLVDGYNRHEICEKLDIDYDIKSLEFENDDEAMLWIINHQFGRRNLNPFQRCELALKMKDVIAARAKANQCAAGGVVKQKSAKPIDTREELAEMASVSADTIAKAWKIIEKASDEDKEELRSGKITINAVYTKLNKRDANPEQKVEGDAIQRMIKSLKNIVLKLCKEGKDLSQDCTDDIAKSWDMLGKAFK